MEEKTAQLEWRDGVPVSGQFDDPYYSLDDGLAESRFVFLEGINLPELAANCTAPPLVIGETGFGTGLNFLATWQWWRENASGQKLTFISVEKYPISAGDLTLAHKAFPELKKLSAELIAAWPPPARGFHCLNFDGGNIRLILLFDDAASALTQLNARVDAWYLDGFAPAKNPEMWTQAVFDAMAALSRPGAPVATFTAAGFVRRGLIEAGFIMSKHPGFGRKRERLLGQFQEPAENTNRHHTTHHQWAEPQASSMRETATIIGAGIAGGSAAYALRQRGLAVKLIETESTASSHGLPAAILVPRFLLEDQPERHFFDAALAYCLNHPAYQHAFSSHMGAEVIASASHEEERFDKILASYGWPVEWLRKEGKSLHLPKSGSVEPSIILEQMTRGCERISALVSKIEKHSDQWHVYDNSYDCVSKSDILIVAAGPHTTRLLACIDNSNIDHPKLTPNLGQLVVAHDVELPDVPPHTLSYGGYVSAAVQNGQGQQVRTIGSTFEKLAQTPNHCPSPTEEARAKILEQFSGAVSNEDPISSALDWAGVRATVPDHMPYCGPVPVWSSLKSACKPLKLDAKAALASPVDWQTGLYCLTGLGSKGFQYGPLLGEYLAAMICAEPLPISKDLIGKLHPARSMVREIIRSQVKQ